MDRGWVVSLGTGLGRREVTKHKLEGMIECARKIKTVRKMGGMGGKL